MHVHTHTHTHTHVYVHTSSKLDLQAILGFFKFIISVHFGCSTYGPSLLMEVCLLKFCSATDIDSPKLDFGVLFTALMLKLWHFCNAVNSVMNSI